MNIARNVIAATLVASAMGSSPVLAQDAGFYLGGSLGQSKSNETCDGFPVACDDKDTAWRIFGGYQFNRYISAELGYADLGTPASASGTVSGVAVVANTEVTAWDLVAVGSYPIGRFSIYGKLGLYRAETETSGSVAGIPLTGSDTNTDITFGAGAGFDITRNLRIRGEWQRYQNVGGDSGGEDDVDVFSVGLLWRF